MRCDRYVTQSEIGSRYIRHALVFLYLVLPQEPSRQLQLGVRSGPAEVSEPNVHI